MQTFDVIIIGAGIIGCATARFLSRYRLNILVLERGADVAVGATKANSGILHSGYDCEPGTQKAVLNIQGLAMYPRLAQELNIPYRINGSMVVSFESNMNTLEKLHARGLQNGVTGLELLSGEEARALEPNLNSRITGALRSKTAGIISPYEAAIAFAENSASNGVQFLLETTVTDVTNASNGYIVHTSAGDFCAPAIVNAAGVDSGNIHNMLCAEKEAILPQRGEYYLLDNTQRNLVGHTIFQTPTHLGKGILVAPTVDGNILLGPTAHFINDGDDTQTTGEGLTEVLEKAGLSLQHVPIRDRIANFAGVRAKHTGKDFVLKESQSGFFEALGIDSPGLTAAPAIASRLGEMVSSHLQPQEKPNFNPNRVGITRFRDLSHAEKTDYIRQNPAYGRIVCRCETITEAEIIEAIRRPLGAKNLDALKRRTRAQMGRCQGGFCTIRLMELLARELDISETAITKSGQGSEVCEGHI